jgi:hypothetical protein
VNTENGLYRRSPVGDEPKLEEAVRAAARTIGEMPETDIRSKFAQLQTSRRARSEDEIIRQQAETDSLELDEGAYQAALKHEESGDLKAAARWYRAAAVNDFPGASIRLASVLKTLAAEHHDRGETQAEQALIEDASQWCMKAGAAGEGGALALIEELETRLDPDQMQADPAPNPDEYPVRCPYGGLRKAAAELDQDDKLGEHLHSCGPCRAEHDADYESAPTSR